MEKSESNHYVWDTCLWIYGTQVFIVCNRKGVPHRYKIYVAFESENIYEMGEVNFKNLFVYGTKIEVYSNKCTFVWKSAVEKNVAKLEKKIRRHTNRMFENIVADAGYESSENYLYLEENGQNCFIKPQNYEIRKKRSYKANTYTVENMEYNAKRDEYICPNGRKLKFKRESTKLPRMAIQSQPSITVTTNAEDVRTEINAINLKRATEQLK